MKRVLRPAVLLSLGTLLAACAPQRVIVVAAPPPPRVAVVGVAPGPGFIWTQGFWDLRGATWVWVEGHWMRPPRPRAVWVPARWVEVSRGHWRLERVHWR